MLPTPPFSHSPSLKTSPPFIGLPRFAIKDNFTENFIAMKKLSIYFAVMVSLMAFQKTAAQGPNVTWEKSDYIGATSRFYDVEKTSDGGSIAIGWKDSDGHALIVKTKANGQEQWRYETLISPWSYTGTSISQTSDGGYIAGGYYQGDTDGNTRGFLLKLSSTGAKQWIAANLYGYNSSKIYSVRQSSDGTYIFGGTTHKDDNNRDYGWVRKVNASGNQIWDKITEGLDNCSIPSIIPINDALGSGYLQLFYSTYSNGYYRIFRKDENYNDIWLSDFMYGVSSDASLTVSNNGFTMIYSFPVSGWGKQIGVKKYVLIPVGSSFIYGESFSENYGLLGDETITRNRNIRQTPDNGFVFVGSTKSIGNGGFDMWVVKLDADGAMKWQKALGTSNTDYGYGIDITNDGGYIASGMKNGKAWLVKLGGSLGTDEISKNKVSLYPNPVKDVLHISSEKEIESVNIFNMAGQKVAIPMVVVSKQINTSSLAPGTYLVQIKFRDGETRTEKIIKK